MVEFAVTTVTGSLAGGGEEPERRHEEVFNRHINASNKEHFIS